MLEDMNIQHKGKVMASKTRAELQAEIGAYQERAVSLIEDRDRAESQLEHARKTLAAEMLESDPGATLDSLIRIALDAAVRAVEEKGAALEEVAALKERVAGLGQELHDAKAGQRQAAQLLIAEIGAGGPEGIMQTARRAVTRIGFDAGAISRLTAALSKLTADHGAALEEVEVFRDQCAGLDEARKMSWDALRESQRNEAQAKRNAEALQARLDIAERQVAAFVALARAIDL
jgi:hypothetical protein